MPKLRRLSGPEVVKILGLFGFVLHSQRGSHLKLKRRSASGESQTLTVPNHRELDTGTCHGIFPSGDPLRLAGRTPATLLHRLSPLPVIVCGGSRRVLEKSFHTFVTQCLNPLASRVTPSP